MKYLTFIISAIVILLLWIFYFGDLTPKNITSLKSYWRDYGFSVVVRRNTPEEEKILIETRKLIKSSGENGNYPYKETEDMSVDDVPVNVTLYRDKDTAKEFYDYSTTIEKNRKQLPQMSDYFKSEYFLNKSLILRIDYYKVDDNNKASALNLDAKKVNQISSTFLKF